MRTDISRRALLATAVSTTAVSVAGCLDQLGLGDPDCEFIDEVSAAAGTTEWDDLPALEGELVVYSGRTDDQIHPVLQCIEDQYDDFDLRVSYDDNESIRNELIEVGGNAEADVFYSQDSATLATIAHEGLSAPLSDDVADIVPAEYRDPEARWTATSGRVRAIQYNTDLVDPDELADDIFAYAEDDRYAGRIATRPNSGSFHAFVAAMIDLEGEERTREWMRGLVEDQDIELFASGSAQAQAVADGEVDIALGNQYYAARLLRNDPDTPIDLAFTDGDVGSLFNVAGVTVLDSADDIQLAEAFVEHLLAAEAQYFFMDVNGEYPIIDGIEYVGDLPAADDIDPPSYDLSQLVDLERALDVQRDEDLVV